MRDINIHNLKRIFALILFFEWIRKPKNFTKDCDWN